MAGCNVVQTLVHVLEEGSDNPALTAHLGGGSIRLPPRMVSHRRRLRFVYFDGDRLRPLTFAEVRVA